MISTAALIFRCFHAYPDGFKLEADFQLGAGVTALFGPSGSGKTTVLAIIAGLIKPDRGLVQIGDRVLLDTTKRLALPPERRGVGFVPQDHFLFPHLRVEANLRYGLERRPVRRIDFQRVVDVLEIGELLARYPGALSGGERQRVALGRAILRGPELLLLDEPLAAIDDALKDRILSYLERAFAEWQIPTLFVSHDRADVTRLAVETVVLRAGSVASFGPTTYNLSVNSGSNKLKVLFLCTGNSCRSQMAEGWAQALKGDVIDAYSAGIETHGLNPIAVKVMAEAGVDISGHRSKNVAELAKVSFDYVVTVCGHASERCPVFHGPAKVIHAGFDDPPKLAKDAKSPEEALAHYRQVRDEIKAFVSKLPDNFEQFRREGPP